MKPLFILVGTLLILTAGGRWLKDQFTVGNYWAFAWWMAGVCALAWIVMHDHERQDIMDGVRRLLCRQPEDEDR
jgi:heme exporter protein D